VGERREVYRTKWDRERIRALRQHLGLSQDELATELGMRQQTISEWETGRYEPRGGSARLLTLIAEQAGFEYGKER
jgi:DNA-binding transcriptional regulator YiaG